MAVLGGRAPEARARPAPLRARAAGRAQARRTCRTSAGGNSTRASCARSARRASRSRTASWPATPAARLKRSPPRPATRATSACCTSSTGSEVPRPAARLPCPSRADAQMLVFWQIAAAHSTCSTPRAHAGVLGMPEVLHIWTRAPRRAVLRQAGSRGRRAPRRGQVPWRPGAARAGQLRHAEPAARGRQAARRRGAAARARRHPGRRAGQARGRGRGRHGRLWCASRIWPIRIPFFLEGRLAKQRLGGLTVGSVNWRALAAACALCRGRPLTLTLHYTAQTPTPPACCLRGAAWHLLSAPLRTAPLRPGARGGRAGPGMDGALARSCFLRGQTPVAVRAPVAAVRRMACRDAQAGCSRASRPSCRRPRCTRTASSCSAARSSWPRRPTCCCSRRA